MSKDANDSRSKTFSMPKFSYSSREEYEDYGAGRGRTYRINEDKA